MGTVNILEAAFNSDSVVGIVVATTDKVYRNDNSGVRFTETDALAGKDPYSASKVGVESAVAAWQQISAISGGPKVVAVRAGNVIGGGDWAEDRLIPDLIRGFASDSDVIVRNPSSTRPWQHVLDPLVGYVMALEASLIGEQIGALNFGPDSKSLSVKEVVRISTEKWPLPTKVIIKVANPRLVSEAVALELDSSKARVILGWRSEWSQSESVETTITWWDKVLNQSVNVLDACDADIDFMLAKVRSLGNS
jgi:CDP-glucose 4,6-dehydratase